MAEMAAFATAGATTRSDTRSHSSLHTFTHMERQPWTAHEFPLGIDPGWTSNVVNRLQGTVIRLKHYTFGLSDEEAARQDGGAWSIKQHVGHLIDLEDLHSSRLHEFKARKKELSAADMSNLRTEEADHNSKELEELVLEFERIRNELLELQASLEPDDLVHEAMHPRLKVVMKPVDMLFFTAEHDDHHLTTIARLLGQ